MGWMVQFNPFGVVGELVEDSSDYDFRAIEEVYFDWGDGVFLVVEKQDDDWAVEIAYIDFLDDSSVIAVGLASDEYFGAKREYRD